MFKFSQLFSKQKDDKYPYGKPQTDEVAWGSGNREYGCRRLREKLPNFSGVSFFRAGNSSNRVNAFHICVYVHTFQNGKIYNCDLSAAQNIGARFFLREYQKKGADGFPSTPFRTLSTLREFVNNGLPVAT